MIIRSVARFNFCSIGWVAIAAWLHTPAYAVTDDMPPPKDPTAAAAPAEASADATAAPAAVEQQTLKDEASEAKCPEKPKKPPAPKPWTTAYKPVFYDNDFKYLRDPNYSDYHLGEELKQMPVGECGDCGTMDVGGQVRLRYHYEKGMGQDIAGPGTQRFQDTEHDFLLSRVRLYTNWRVDETTRFYVEGIFADVTDDGGTYMPRIIDRNWGDFLNCFVDYTPEAGTTLRVGRQELIYGAERLISPLDWANTRRTFDGVKVMLSNDEWKVDGFYTYYVPVVPNELDEADWDQPFYGVYATYGGCEHDKLDLYYIGYDNKNPGTITSDFSLHTLGSRLYGDRGDWLYDAEGGVQVGRQSGLGLDQEAGFATGGIGRKLPQYPWKPTIWFYYDYASGNFPGDDFNRFNQLFPLSHKYFGFIDAVQRSNIEAPNVLLTMKPEENWDLLFWYWRFIADSASDIVPSIGGTPNQSLTRTHFGDEIDILAKRTLSARSNLVLGYSHFWRGNKILAPEDADFVYTQWEVNF